MVNFSRQFAFATTIALVTVGAIDLRKTQAASLYLGLSQYVENIQLHSNIGNIEETLLSPQPITRRNTIQENIANHYYDLVEEDTDKISLIETRKILKDNGFLAEIGSEDGGQSLKELTSLTDKNILSVQAMLREGQAHQQIPKSILYSLILLFGLWLIPTLNYISKTFIFGKDGLVDDLQDKFGKPEVPEGTIFMHDRALKDLEKIAQQVGRINADKFGNKEFLLFVKIRQSIEKGLEEYKAIGDRAELLKVAITAQSSFLRIEQTELRFRSRHQQEFYQFVIDSLNQDIDKAKFRNQIKRKLADIIPLLNTEEGREALQAYLKEIDKISEHKLGLKLLALFKQYQLADFTILKRVSAIVNQFKEYDLLTAKSLVTFVINDYEIFEKLGPIIGVSESESSPETYANILQHIGLISRHEKSYEKFQQLLEALRKWQKPYKKISMIRQEYQASEYRLPQEFSQDIPGLNIYKKYEKFL